MEVERIEKFEEFIAKCVEECAAEWTQPVNGFWYRRTGDFSFVAGIIDDFGDNVVIQGKIIDDDDYEIKEIAGENLSPSSLLTMAIADSVREDLPFVESEDGSVWYRRVNDNFVAGAYDIVAYGELYGTRDYKVKKVVGDNLDLKGYFMPVELDCSVKAKRQHKRNRQIKP